MNPVYHSTKYKQISQQGNMSTNNFISCSNYYSFKLWKGAKPENYMLEYIMTKFGNENRLWLNKAFTFLLVFNVRGFTLHTRYILYSAELLETKFSFPKPLEMKMNELQIANALVSREWGFRAPWMWMDAQRQPLRKQADWGTHSTK